MVKISCCPNFKIASFVTLKIITDLTLYVLLLISGGLNQAGSLLSPNQSALFYFGEKFPYYIKEYNQIYRLITSLCLNVNIVQLLSNIAGYMIYGSFVERFLGFFKTFIVFLMFGVGGCLFSCLLKSEPEIDASTTTMGFIGFEAGILLTSWDLWDYPGSGRYQMSMIIVLGLVVNFTLGASYTLIDNISMAAGMILGLFLSFILMRSESETKVSKKCFRCFFASVIIIYYIIATVIFMFLVTPTLI